MALLAYHYGPYLQRGHGIGSFFSKLTRYLVPIAKSVVKPAAKRLLRTAKKEALTAGSSFATQALSGLNRSANGSSFPRSSAKRKKTITRPKFSRRKLTPLL